MLMPQVTVLMPVFNSGKFLDAAISSILSQTYPDFEFIIIDDGSTDNSAAIIKSFKDPRIRFFQNEINLGITRTLNKGIELASTEYIARMDADDISYPDRLKKQYKYLREHPDCALVSSLVRVINEDGDFVREDNFKSKYYYYNLTFFSWIYHPSVMYRKKAVESVNKYTVDYAEDFELFWQLSRLYKIHNMDEVLLEYRISNQSLHLVLRKEEHERAHREQMLRNIRYYTGYDYSVPVSYLECFRHNFQPLLAEQNMKVLADCIKELDFITACILNKENINYDADAIKKAAKYKRDYIITSISKHLTLHKSILLRLRLETPESLVKILKMYIKKRYLRSDIIKKAL
jgi:glycosyltransferase involved in cell wall biosynthesis